MKRISIGAILVSCMLAALLAGCAGGKSTDAESLKGFWALEDSAQLGFKAALNLDEDNLAELVIGDSYLDGTWAVDGTNATVEFTDGTGQKAPICVSNGKLILGLDDGSKLIFAKGDMNTYFDDVNNAQGGSASSLSAGSDDIQVVDEKIDDIKPVTLVDDDTVKVEVTGKGTDFTADPGYRLSVTNKTKKTIYLTADDAFKVGDKSIEAGLGEIVEPGQTVETFIYFPKDQLGGSTEALKSVTGKMVVGDDETGDEMKTYDFKMD